MVNSFSLYMTQCVHVALAIRVHCRHPLWLKLNSSPRRFNKYAISNKQKVGAALHLVGISRSLCGTSTRFSWECWLINMFWRKRVTIQTPCLGQFVSSTSQWNQWLVGHRNPKVLRIILESSLQAQPQVEEPELDGPSAYGKLGESNPSSSLAIHNSRSGYGLFMCVHSEAQPPSRLIDRVRARRPYISKSNASNAWF